LNYRAIANATLWKIYLLYFVGFVKSDYFLLTTNHKVLFFIWICLDWNYFKYFSTCFFFFRLILKILHLIFNKTWSFKEKITIPRHFTNLILKYLFYLLFFFLGTRLLNYSQISFLNMRILALLVLCHFPFYLFLFILAYFSLFVI
jgi:hypothetical protein